MKENRIVSIVDFIISILCIMFGIYSIIIAILENADPNPFYTRICIVISLAFFILAYF